MRTKLFSFLVISLVAILPFRLNAQVLCNAPTGLTTSNVTKTGAILSWNADSSALAYKVQYKPITNPASAWINVTTQTNSITLTNLTCGTHYEWQVAAYCGTSSGSISPFSVGMAFHTDSCSALPCNAPTGLVTTNITTTGAKLSWTASAGAYAYVVQYKPMSNPSAAWITVTTQTNSILLSNLTCGTQYTWHVAAHCGNAAGSISPYSPSITFTTLTCTSTCVPPTGLLTTNVTKTSATLSWTAVVGVSAYLVQYKPITNPASSWINVTAQTNSINLSNLTCGTHYEWHVASYCSSAINNISPYSQGMGFVTDSCTVTPCNPPTGLTTTNITATSAKLMWTASAGVSLYMVQYKPVLNPNAQWINVTAQTNYVILSNLSCGTVYEWHVATHCSNNNGTVTLSPYSPSITFATDSCTVSPCNPPAGLANINISTTGATLTWTPVVGAVGYLVQYKPLSNTGTAWINVTTQTNSVTLSNLTCGTQYQWHVAAQCNPATGILGPYSPSIIFTTLPCTNTCIPPTGLITTNITKNGATLKWVPVPGVTSYKLNYRPVTNAIWQWTTVTVQGNMFTLNNLNCGAPYQWQVASICPAAGTISISNFSPIVDFTTLACTTNGCAVPTGLTTNNAAANPASITLLWNATGAISYNIRYKKANTTAWTTLNSTTTTQLLFNLQPGQYQWQVQSVCSSSNGVITLSPWSAMAYFYLPVKHVIFPNPATSDNIFLPISADVETNVNIIITDKFGKTLKKLERVVLPGTDAVNIDVSDLRNGIYFIQVNGENINELQKIMIAK